MYSFLHLGVPARCSDKTMGRGDRHTGADSTLGLAKAWTLQLQNANHMYLAE